MGRSNQKMESVLSFDSAYFGLHSVFSQLQFRKKRFPEIHIKTECRAPVSIFQKRSFSNLQRLVNVQRRYEKALY